MADEKGTTGGSNPPIPPAPKTSGSTPSVQGVTKPGQGAVPETPPGNPQAPVSGVNTPLATHPTDATKKATEGGVTLSSKDDQVNKSSSEQATRTGPAISTDSPFRQRMRALEQSLRQTQEDRSRQGQAARAQIQAQLAELKDAEARRHQGANPRAPRGNLLAAGAIQEQYPDDHLRWVNESVEGRADYVKGLGYVRVDESAGVGGMKLYRIPRDKWAASEVGKQRETERALRVATGDDRDAQLNDLQQHLEKQGWHGDVREIFYHTKGGR